MRYSDAAALMPKKVARYDARPVPVDPSLLAALKWNKRRIDLAQEAAIDRRVRRALARTMPGSRYQGGSSFAARSR